MEEGREEEGGRRMCGSGMKEGRKVGGEDGRKEGGRQRKRRRQAGSSQ